jgi:hypothetical protein
VDREFSLLSKPGKYAFKNLITCWLFFLLAALFLNGPEESSCPDQLLWSACARQTQQRSSCNFTPHVDSAMTTHRPTFLLVPFVEHFFVPPDKISFEIRRYNTCPHFLDQTLRQMMETLLSTSNSSASGPISGAESFDGQVLWSSSLLPMVRTTSKHRMGQQRGSLPLKKRLRYLPTAPQHGFSLEGLSSSTDHDDNDSQKNQAFQPFSNVQEQDSTSTTITPSDLPIIGYSRLDSSRANDEKLAALALITAAAATSESALDESRRSSNNSGCSTSSFLPPLLPETRPFEASRSSSTAPTWLSVPTLPVVSLPEDVLYNTPTPNRCTPRTNRAQLAQPLPNGCHFRTSRNNSFCRKHPCYNESKYCKLHYHHFKIAVGNRQLLQPDVAGVADTTSEQVNAMEATLTNVLTDKTIPGVSSALQQQEGNGLTVDAQVGTTPSEEQLPQATVATLLLLPLSGRGGGATTTLPPAHQDRRFSSATNGEPRCLATTTRGRPCAYIAVNCTKYCYLHAEYDTHPPPRRGGACQQIQLQNQQVKGSKTQEKTQGIQTDMVLTSASKRSEATTLLSGSTKQPMSSSSSSYSPGSLDKDPSRVLHEESSSSAITSVPAQAPQSELYAGLTLLSMISSDRWFHKLVIVAAGPLINRTGTVEKWGNG